MIGRRGSIFPHEMKIEDNKRLFGYRKVFNIGQDLSTSKRGKRLYDRPGKRAGVRLYR